MTAPYVATSNRPAGARTNGYVTLAAFGYAPHMAGKISEETKLDWLRLIRSDHVGPHTFRMLLARCGNARAALEGLPDLARRGGAAGPLRIYSREEPRDRYRRGAGGRARSNLSARAHRRGTLTALGLRGLTPR